MRTARPSRARRPVRSRTSDSGGATRAVRSAALAALALAACEGAPGPEPGSPEYGEVVGAFYTGVAAIQVGEDARAQAALSRVAELAPREPAAAANLAVLAYQQQRLDDAARWIQVARDAGGEDPRLALLSALVERERGLLDRAIAELDPLARDEDPDPRALLLLSRLLEQRGAQEDVAESRRLLEALTEAAPNNVFVAVERARHAARHRDGERLAREVERLDTFADAWPEPLREQLGRVRAALGSPQDVGPELTFLVASLESLRSYGADRRVVVISEQQPELVFTRFLRLPKPSPRPPPPDLELEFAARPVDAGATTGDGSGRGGAPAAEAPAGGPARDAPWQEVRPVWLEGTGPARIALVSSGAAWLVGDTAAPVRLPVPGDPTPGAPAALAAFDLDRDFRMELALAGGGGLRLLDRGEGGDFTELAGALPAAVARRAYTGAWPADTDLDGDVDLVLAPRDGSPFVLRNRGDGTFVEEPRFEGVTGARRFVWGDLDHDGDPDAVFLNAGGRVAVLANPRQDRPRFVPLPVPGLLEPALGIALGDMEGDGRFELLALREDGTLARAGWNGDGWETGEVERWEGLRAGAEDGRLFVADVDNNGALDVIASAGGRTRLWLGDGDYALVPHRTLDATVTAVADLTGGRVELLGTDAAGAPVRLSPRPTRNYYALTVSPRATDQPGDGRINTFGLGGQAEVRAGMLYQKQPIDQPFVHFGIGDNTGVTVARILWPNGTAQAEFDLLATTQGEPIVAQQRLKGSCPWLFAFDGDTLRFVTDAAWRTALGLRINAYGDAAVVQSQDWVRVRGDQLAARDGLYDLRITAELWESHFFDHVALMVVDHPRGTEALVDERFFLPPPELEVRATGPLRPVASATDHRGRDVLPRVEALDERYVDGFELGEYQGLARREHFVEVELGAAADPGAPLLLVAQGWVYPTDGSINLALGQGTHAPPRGLRVDVPDGRGGWRVLHEDLGMPAGKTKTVLVDLRGAFPDGGPRRVRLATTMEIYWDRLTWTEARPGTELRTTRLVPETAELRYRGFNVIRQAGRRAPEIPRWELATTAPLWRDLEGFHTRFGDVRPLLTEIDDRYVIMNAGDEMALTFRAPPAAPEGWVRDFVFVSDAWVKDGDFNNGFSGTLRPLPWKGMDDYSTPPGRLGDDPVFQRHREDWRAYHTRYVSPRRFHHALSND